MTTTFQQSETLPIEQVFCAGQMACRFLRALDSTDPLILAIPGGPGLSNIYFDPFMRNLAERTGANVGIMDLPNHGASRIKEIPSPLAYTHCCDFVQKTVEEISNKTRILVLFGQSFGARLAFDLLARLEKPPQAVLLTGFPYIFEISSALATKLNELPLEAEEGSRAEEIHAENWRKILPLYTVQPVSDDTFTALATRAEVPDGHLMLQDAPEIQEVAKKAKNTVPILVIEAELDPVVPDNNWNVLRGLLTSATFQRIENVGHFPIAEKPEEILGAFSGLIEQARSNSR